MTFSYKQKKWAMTTALLVALGFNISFKSTAHQLESKDLSSTNSTVSEEITTKKGKARVVYLSQGHNKFLALVEKENTEGSGYCNHCGFDEYMMSVDPAKNKIDFTELNAALAKTLDEKKDLPPVKNLEKKTVKEKEKEQDQDTDDVEVPKKSKKSNHNSDLDSEIEDLESDDEQKNKVLTLKKLVRLEKDCKDELTDKFTCLSEGVTDLLSFDNASDKLDKKLINTFFKKKVLPHAQTEFDSTIKASTLALRLQSIAMTHGVPDQHLLQELNSLGNSMSPEQAIAKRNELINSLSRFIETTPNEYDELRSNLISNESQILRNEAENIQRLRTLMSVNPSQAAILNTEAISRGILLTDLKNKMAQNGLGSIDIAVKNENLTPNTANKYIQYFNLMMNNPVETSSGTIVNSPSQTIGVNPTGNINENMTGLIQNTITNSLAANRFNAGRGTTSGGVLNNNSIPLATPLNQPLIGNQTGRGF